LLLSKSCPFVIRPLNILKATLLPKYLPDTEILVIKINYLRITMDWYTIVKALIGKHDSISISLPKLRILRVLPVLEQADYSEVSRLFPAFSINMSSFITDPSEVLVRLQCSRERFDLGLLINCTPGLTVTTQMLLPPTSIPTGVESFEISQAVFCKESDTHTFSPFRSSALKNLTVKYLYGEHAITSKVTNEILKYLPPSLNVLFICSSRFTLPLQQTQSFPPSLRKLTLLCTFTHPRTGHLPSDLEQLDLILDGFCEDCKPYEFPFLDLSCLPATIKVLRIIPEFMSNLMICGVLPERLEMLVTGGKVRLEQELGKGVIRIEEN